MKEIRLSGVVGLDVLPGEFAKQLNDARGDSLEIVVASPGGSVFDGVEIFNAIRDYRRKYSGAQITVKISGVAASMASYIAVTDAANRVIAEDNAVFMIHNPWNVTAGDWRDSQKNAEFLRGLADLMKGAYAKRSGKTVGEIGEMMDNETWLFGSQIQEAGFADEIIAAPADQQTDESVAMTRAQFAVKSVKAKLKEHEPDPVVIQQAAAHIREMKGEITPMKPSEHQTALQAAIEQIKIADIPDAEKARLLAMAAGGMTHGGDNDRDIRTGFALEDDDGITIEYGDGEVFRAPGIPEV